jgi:hypothetical protein
VKRDFVARRMFVYFGWHGSAIAIQNDTRHSSREW